MEIYLAVNRQKDPELAFSRQLRALFWHWAETEPISSVSTI